MTIENTPQAKPVAETKRTPLENFVDGFPIDLAKRAVKANYTELFMGAIVSSRWNFSGVNIATAG